MQTIAIIKDGLVLNTALWDGETEWSPGEEFITVDVTGTNVGPGWTYDGVNFTQPEQIIE